MLTEAERAAHYTRDLYLHGGHEEAQWFRAGRLRPDGVAAIGYALGHKVPLKCVDVGKWPDQIACIRNHGVPRMPKLALSVGCGRGDNEAAMLALGVPLVAIDFSMDACELTRETIKRLADLENSCILNLALSDVPPVFKHQNLIPDTVLFIESIEHIPEVDFDAFLPYVKAWHARLIVVNWINFHPIRADDSGWGHIRDVTDEHYDAYSAGGQVIFRQGSHLVVQF